MSDEPKTRTWRLAASGKYFIRGEQGERINLGEGGQRLNALEREVEQLRAENEALVREVRHDCADCEQGYTYEVDPDDSNSAWHPVTDRVCELNQGQRTLLAAHDARTGGTV